MAKEKTAYVCTQCGYDSPKWAGRCPSCGEWNTMKEIRISTTASRQVNCTRSARFSAESAVSGFSDFHENFIAPPTGAARMSLLPQKSGLSLLFVIISQSALFCNHRGGFAENCK